MRDIAIIDLTQPMAWDMPVFPGTPAPEFTTFGSLEQEGFRETMLHLSSHTGTHMDAPAHVLREGATLDRLSVDRFVGAGTVVDCAGVPPGSFVTMAHLTPFLKEIDAADFVLFYTGWDRHWKTNAYFAPFPAPDHEVLQYLAAAGKKGVGMDTLSVDPLEDERLSGHHILLPAGVLIVENLTRLHLLLGKRFTFAALPLLYPAADGAPVRAIGMVDGSAR